MCYNKGHNQIATTTHRSQVSGNQGNGSEPTLIKHLKRDGAGAELVEQILCFS